MRQTRRGCYAAQGGGAKYVWAVYNLAYGIDESAGGTDGSVKLSSSRYKMAAKGYTISDSGTVTLTDPTKTTAANLAVGDYLVNVSTSNSTATTGDTLYKVTGVSGSYNYTISYTAYTPALNVRGTDTGQRVESNTADDYPADGVQGDYYYVMVKGYGTVYIWDVFNVTQKVTGYESNSVTGYSTDSMSSFTYGTSMSFDSKTGYFTLSGTETLSMTENSFTNYVETENNYWMEGSTKKAKYCYMGGNWYTGNKAKNVRKYTSTAISETTKGSATGEQVQSVSQTAYPSDGVQGDYWYTYNSSYTGWFDFT